MRRRRCAASRALRQRRPICYRYRYRCCHPPPPLHSTQQSQSWTRRCAAAPRLHPQHALVAVVQRARAAFVAVPHQRRAQVRRSLQLQRSPCWASAGHCYRQPNLWGSEACRWVPHHPGPQSHSASSCDRAESAGVDVRGRGCGADAPLLPLPLPPLEVDVAEDGRDDGRAVGCAPAGALGAAGAPLGVGDAKSRNCGRGGGGGGSGSGTCTTATAGAGAGARALCTAAPPAAVASPCTARGAEAPPFVARAGAAARSPGRSCALAAASSTTGVAAAGEPRV